jgi:hypothetical protein
MLKDGIEKKSIKKIKKSELTHVNLLNSWFGS